MSDLLRYEALLFRIHKLEVLQDFLTPEKRRDLEVVKLEVWMQYSDWKEVQRDGRV